MSQSLHFEVLRPSVHDRDSFDCGEESLNIYLKRTANQQSERFLGRTLVAVSAQGETRIIGYYTLAASAIDTSALPEGSKLGMSVIPVILLGRLAVDKEFHGQKLGTDLLINALARCYRVARRDIGAHAVIVDALNESARSFYTHFGFDQLLDDRLHLFITMRSIEKLGLVHIAGLGCLS